MQWITQWAESEVIAEGPLMLTGSNSQTHVALWSFCSNPPSWRQPVKLFLTTLQLVSIRSHSPPWSKGEEVSVIDIKDVPILKKIIQLQTTCYLHVVNKRGWKHVRAPRVSPLAPLLHFPSWEHHHLVLPAIPLISGRSASAFFRLSNYLIFTKVIYRSLPPSD